MKLSDEVLKSIVFTKLPTQPDCRYPENERIIDPDAAIRDLSLCADDPNLYDYDLAIVETINDAIKLLQYYMKMRSRLIDTSQIKE